MYLFSLITSSSVPSRERISGAVRPRKCWLRFGRPMPRDGCRLEVVCALLSARADVNANRSDVSGEIGAPRRPLTLPRFERIAGTAQTAGASLVGRRWLEGGPGTAKERSLPAGLRRARGHGGASLWLFSGRGCLPVGLADQKSGLSACGIGSRF
jgi:hypothetical protein